MLSNTAPLSQVRENREGVTVDWLDVRSEFVDPAPVFAAVISDHTDQESGELYRTWRGREVEGSWRSSLLIRSDGRCVRISGNPSRWGQPENVGGVSTVEAALRIFDRELIARGLPPVLASARIARLDLCENLSVGRGQERAFLRWCSGQVLRGKPGFLYPDGTTCAFVGRKGSRKLYVKYYAKAPELRMHRQCSDDQKAWRERCAEWCESVGLVRHEVTLRGDWLSRRGLATVREWCKGGDAAKVLESYAAHLRPEAAADPFGDVTAKLVDMGFVTRRAKSLEMVARAWAAGADCRGTMSRSAYYRARAPLLRLGFDIANPFDVARCASVVPVIEVRGVGVPPWYGERVLLAA